MLEGTAVAAQDTQSNAQLTHRTLAGGLDILDRAVTQQQGFIPGPEALLFPGGAGFELALQAGIGPLLLGQAPGHHTDHNTALVEHFVALADMLGRHVATHDHLPVVIAVAIELPAFGGAL